MSNMKWLQAAFTVFILLSLMAAVVLVSINGPTPEAKAGTNCQQYADKATFILERSDRSSASWSQSEALRALAYSTLYAGCKP